MQPRPSSLLFLLLVLLLVGCAAGTPNTPTFFGRSKPESPAAPVVTRAFELHARGSACAPVLPSKSYERTATVTPNRAALTFDDGPRPGATPAILELLAKHQLKATFFVIGQLINRQTYRIIQRTVAEGQEIGLHSYNHDVDMAMFGPPAVAKKYIVAEHEVTRILIDLALLATNDDEFDDLFERVLGVAPLTVLPPPVLLEKHQEIAARHLELLTERGFRSTKRPSKVRFSRPPGGGPYLGSKTSVARKTYDLALIELGYTNVMWHGASGDTILERLHDVSFLASNTIGAAKRGGVVLLHDAIDKRALRVALDTIVAAGVHVVSLENLMFGACSP